MFIIYLIIYHSSQMASYSVCSHYMVCNRTALLNSALCAQ